MAPSVSAKQKSTGEKTAKRLLVAGGASHAGKSTVSLGLLASLLEAGFLPSEIAYIRIVESYRTNKVTITK